MRSGTVARSDCVHVMYEATDLPFHLSSKHNVYDLYTRSKTFRLCACMAYAPLQAHKVATICHRIRNCEHYATFI